jgi:hypothetical protein
MNMSGYTVTAKLWITVDAESPEEAEDVAKDTIDEAMYHYVKDVLEGTSLRISKAKVIWVKENAQKDMENDK